MRRESVSLIPDTYVIIIWLALVAILAVSLWHFYGSEFEDTSPVIFMAVVLMLLCFSLPIVTLSPFIIPADAYTVEETVSMSQNIDNLHISNIDKSFTGRLVMDFNLDNYNQQTKLVLMHEGGIVDSNTFKDGIEKSQLLGDKAKLEEYELKVLDKDGNLIDETGLNYQVETQKEYRDGWFHLNRPDGFCNTKHYVTCGF